jgi:hypothetical protein
VRQLCQAASGNVRLSVMKLKLRLAFTTQPCPAFYKYHLSGLTEVGVRAEAGSLTQRAAVAKQTAQTRSEPGRSGAHSLAGKCSVALHRPSVASWPQQALVT